MIPSNAFTSTPIQAGFISPYNRAYQSLITYAPGGNAIGDASAGREVKIWVAQFASGNITVGPEGGPTAFTLPQTDVYSLSLAFDNNMGIALAWMTSASGGRLYYYDTVSLSYTTRTFTGITSCRICVDDTRDVALANSDIIFAYTTGSALKYRQQRDRYNTEYHISNTTKKIRRMGMNNVTRLQFEVL